MAGKVYVPFDCPKCREPGLVRANLLGKSLQCRNCRFVFHLNRMMQPKPGPKPPGADEEPNPHLRQKTRRVRPWPKWLRAVQPAFQGKYGYLWGAAAACSLLALGLAAASAFRAPPLPESFAEREKMVTAALQAGDLKQLLRVSTGPSGAAADFLHVVRGAEKTMPNLKATHKTNFKDVKQGEAGTTVRFLSAKGDDALVVRYYWKLVEAPDDWRLDVARVAGQRLSQ